MKQFGALSALIRVCVCSTGADSVCDLCDLEVYDNSPDFYNVSAAAILRVKMPVVLSGGVKPLRTQL